MEKREYRIGGMVCGNCEGRVAKAIGELPGVADAAASYRRGTLTVEFDPDTVALADFARVLDELDYTITEGGTGRTSLFLQGAGGVIVLLAVYLLADRLGLLGYLNMFPEAEEGMGYGMIFLVGLLTSAHCIAMCGGINLSQTALADAGTGRSTARPALLYGVGRVVSYTVLGAAAGGLGSLVSFSGGMKGGIQILAGACMILMGLNIMGIFPLFRYLSAGLSRLVPFRMPSGKGRGPLYIGLLNGLMPCGPLQAMQVYALSTGHPLTGAVSMMLFALGTLPLTMGLGLAGSWLGRRFMGRAIRVGAGLVFLMGLSMLANGLRLSGFAGPGLTGGGIVVESAMAGDVQVVDMVLDPTSYQPIRVRPGVPLRWNIRAETACINGCNNRIFVPDFGIEKRLLPGDNLIEFTPDRPGIYAYTCWMGMIASRIIVGDVADTGETPDYDASVLPEWDEDAMGADIPW